MNRCLQFTTLKALVELMIVGCTFKGKTEDS